MNSTTTALFGLFGTGGYGRENMPNVAASLTSLGAIDVCFVEAEPTVSTINGYPILSEDAFFASPHAARYFNIAIANAKIRNRIAEQCIAAGAIPHPIIAPNAVIFDGADIGPGALISAFVTINVNLRIGRFFHANIYSSVGHDCVIGDYVTFAPAVRCNGNVHIGDHAYIGTGAILRDGTSEKPLMIGAGATVGMGAVVTKDVPPGITVVGNPARPMARS